MGTLRDRFNRIFEQAISRVIASFIAGIIATTLTVVISPRLSEALSQQVEAPLLLILILSMFAFIGVLFVGSSLWTLISVSRKDKPYSTEDYKKLEDATMDLLKNLAKVEMGVTFKNKHEIPVFASEVLAQFDVWESTIIPFLNHDQRDEIALLREQISGQNITEAKILATNWVATIKELNNRAKERLANK